MFHICQPGLQHRDRFFIFLSSCSEINKATVLHQRKSYELNLAKCAALKHSFHSTPLRGQEKLTTGAPMVSMMFMLMNTQVMTRGFSQTPPVTFQVPRKE